MADENSSARLAYEIALWRLQQQIEYGRSLDSKLGSAFALSAAMIALLGSALIFAAPVEQEGVEAVVIAAAGLFIANIVVSTAALLIGHVSVGPTSDEIVDAVEIDGDDTPWRRTAEHLAAAEQRNARVLRIKSVLVGTALLFTAATTIAIAAAAILAV